VAGYALCANLVMPLGFGFKRASSKRKRMQCDLLGCHTPAHGGAADVPRALASVFEQTLNASDMGVFSGQALATDRIHSRQIGH
jgi:hypothetical protein